MYLANMLKKFKIRDYSKFATGDFFLSITNIFSKWVKNAALAGGWRLLDPTHVVVDNATAKSIRGCGHGRGRGRAITKNRTHGTRVQGELVPHIALCRASERRRF